MAMRGRKPIVTIEPCVQVVIEVERTDDERADRKMPRDDGTIGRFLRWCAEQEVFPEHGGTVGPGLLVQWFAAEHAEAVRSYFAADHIAAPSDPPISTPQGQTR